MSIQPRSSLRSELLFNLAWLTATMLLLAILLASAVQRSGWGTTAIAVTLLAAVVVFVGIGRFLLDRWVLRPLAGIARSAEAIAAGEAEHRISEDGAEEIASVARALNQLTEQLLQNQTRLAENVRSLDETNQRLIETQRELVQAEKMASLGHLAAGVAHEIGNPLGAVMGYVSLQKRRGGDAEIVEGLEREVRRIDRIVRDLLEYARPGGAIREPLDINTSIERVVALLRDQGWLQRVRVELDLAAELPPILGDPHRIDQIFVNLFRNAESAMEGEGSVAIATSVERYVPEQPVAVRRADDPPGVDYSHLRRMRAKDQSMGKGLVPDREVIRVIVSDSGPGIPQEQIASVFDPFFTTKGPGQGSGLGLAIVAGSVAELGGRIEASSSDRGANFTLFLPTGVREA